MVGDENNDKSGTIARLLLVGMDDLSIEYISKRVAVKGVVNEKGHVELPKDAVGKPTVFLLMGDCLLLLEYAGITSTNTQACSFDKEYTLYIDEHDTTYRNFLDQNRTDDRWLRAPKYNVTDDKIIVDSTVGVGTEVVIEYDRRIDMESIGALFAPVVRDYVAHLYFKTKSNMRMAEYYAASAERHLKAYKRRLTSHISDRMMARKLGK
jgi:hypothetical protein